MSVPPRARGRRCGSERSAARAGEARLAADAKEDGRGGERAVLLSHSVASGDKRESAAASGDAVGRPAARTGWSALHLPSRVDVISFTVRGSGSVWPLDVDSAGRIRPAVLTTQTQERSLGRGPLPEPTLRWSSPQAAAI